MNPELARLQPYPFERLRALLDGARPAALAPLDLSIGEPRHPTPALVLEALAAHAADYSRYPTTQGTPALREAIAAWLERRFAPARVDPGTQVLPVLGSREALFAFAQAVIDRSRPARVLAPNPFYQIYEGAALLAGAQPLYLPSLAERDFDLRLDELPDALWDQVQLAYVCSPANPTGRVLSRARWGELLERSARHGFVIAADECYSEIYPDEAAPPPGGLQVAHELGNPGFERLVVFGSLSKRSSAPGLRSGFVAGDAALVKRFLLYRTYHGSAMSLPIQAASAAAWADEAHVVDNRRRYRAKFESVTGPIAAALPTRAPDGGFYLWARTPGDDAAFARSLYEQQHVTVLPGSFLSREVDGLNPGRGYVRIALVAGEAEVGEAARRIVAHARHLAASRATP